MSDGITIGLGDSLPYIVDSVMGLFGRDATSRGWKMRLSELVKLSAQQASMVQCVGMPQPIPITDIYQRTNVRVPPLGRPQPFESLIDPSREAVIFAGPGCGKTTLLHWMYVHLAQGKDYVPLLITLRWPGAVENLKALVEELERGRYLGNSKKTPVVLLVDGYDEIKERDRQVVSQALMLFSSLAIGSFYLTCRSHYNVYDLKCPHLELAPFTRIDAEKFIRAYSKAYGSELDSKALLKELEDHHLGEFSTHPLMLTLVCILKNGPSQDIPRRAIGLLRRAIDTLTFRWDEAKRVHRTSSIPMDGEERVRCLMRIAFDMDSPQETWEVVQRAALAHLSLIQMKHVNVRILLEEMARFYGLLVPVEEGYWQFTHRTVHDYLSARYWVESGTFDPEAVREWDVHSAYAACLTADATEAMVSMLRVDRDVPAFVECLYNNAPFDPEVIAKAIVERVRTAAGLQSQPQTAERDDVLRVSVKDDVFSVCSDEFLRIIVKTCATLKHWERTYDAAGLLAAARSVAACAMGELVQIGRASCRERE